MEPMAFDFSLSGRYGFDFEGGEPDFSLSREHGFDFDGGGPDFSLSGAQAWPSCPSQGSPEGDTPANG